jgi:hypothetical protein
VGKKKKMETLHSDSFLEDEIQENNTETAIAVAVLFFLYFAQFKIGVTDPRPDIENLCVHDTGGIRLMTGEA